MSGFEGPIRPIVIVHGGAGLLADELHASGLRGVAEAAERGRQALRDGGDAEEAVIAAVRCLEDEPTFNAGRGACLTDEGEFEVDASIMRSRDLAAGGVGGVRNLADPILVAREVMNHTRHHLLVGEGAERFARERGVGTFGRDALWTQKAQDRFDAAVAGRAEKEGRADTVGAIVLDTEGNYCVGGSTGGVLLKMPGRVGDTPILGAGLYAHPVLGAAAATGAGEAIWTHLMAYEVLNRIHDRVPRQAGAVPVAHTFCQQVRRQTRSAVGLIAITGRGIPVMAHASTHLSWAVARGDAEVVAGLSRDDWPGGRA